MDNIEYLTNILEQFEPFTIAEATSNAKSAFDMLCVVNYLLDNILNNVRYEIETEQQQIDYNKLIEIKDNILQIKNNNI